MKNIVTVPTTFEIDIKSVNVTDRPVQDVIITAGYGYVNQKIKDSKTLIHNPGSRHMGIWYPDQSISSESAEQKIKSMKTIIDGETYQGRSATIEELAYYEAMFHEELEDMVLVALSEKVSGDSDRYVAYRSVSDSERGLYLDGWWRDWDADFRFLVVFEKISKSE